ncbi:MAG: TonB family protein [Granulosicoccus sp.]
MDLVPIFFFPKIMFLTFRKFLFENITMKKIITFLFLSFLFQGLIFCQTQEELDLEMEEELNEIRIKVAPEEEKIFKVVEDMPRFPGCEGKGKSKKELKECSEAEMQKFIYSKIKYPARAKENNTQGKVIIKFMVDNYTGTVRNIEILKDIGDGCGEEAKRVILLMNEMGQKWIPGRSRGPNVKAYFTLPVSFKLNDATSNN